MYLCFTLGIFWTGRKSTGQEHLLHKHEALSSDIRLPYKNPGSLHMLPRLLTRPCSSQLWSRFRWRPCVKRTNCGAGDQGNILFWPDSSKYIPLLPYTEARWREAPDRFLSTNSNFPLLTLWKEFCLSSIQHYSSS